MIPTGYTTGVAGTTGTTYVSGTTTTSVPVTSTTYVQGGVGLVPVGHTEGKLAAATAIGTAAALGAEHLVHKKKGHKVRNHSLSSASDYDEDVVERHQGSALHRTNELIAAGVGRYIIRKLLTQYKHGEVRKGEAVEELYDPAKRAAIVAIAQQLIQYKYKSHKFREHALDKVDDEAIDSYRNKALIKGIAVTVLPFLLTQLKNVGPHNSNRVVVNGIERGNHHGAKAIALQAKNYIAGLAGSHRVGTGIGTTGATTTTTTTEVIQPGYSTGLGTGLGTGLATV